MRVGKTECVCVGETEREKKSMCDGGQVRETERRSVCLWTHL